MRTLVRNIFKKITAIVLTGALSLSFGSAVYAAPGKAGNWVPINGDAGVLGYALPDGTWLQDGFTMDGYYVGKYGMWAPNVRILSAWVPARNSWFTAEEAGEFDGFIPFMSAAQAKLSENLHGYRILSVYSNRLTLSSVETQNYKKTKTTRLAMYKNTDINGYTIQVSTELAGDEKDMPNGSGSEWDSMSYYDYQVLRLFTNCVSRCGDKVATAIYSSWEDNNSYGLKMNEWVQVGDTLICYLPDDGAGLYEIKAAF